MNSLSITPPQHRPHCSTGPHFLAASPPHTSPLHHYTIQNSDREEAAQAEQDESESGMQIDKMAMEGEGEDEDEDADEEMDERDEEEEHAFAMAEEGPLGMWLRLWG